MGIQWRQILIQAWPEICNSQRFQNRYSEATIHVAGNMFPVRCHVSRTDRPGAVGKQWTIEVTASPPAGGNEIYVISHARTIRAAREAALGKMRDKLHKC